MRAHLAALFHHADRRVGRELFEADGAGEAGGAGAHDQGIELHGLAGSGLIRHRLSSSICGHGTLGGRRLVAKPAAGIEGERADPRAGGERAAR